MLDLTPVSLADCKRFVALHHRHNEPPSGWKFGVGVKAEDELVGVAVAGRPIARGLDDGTALEVTRTCTTGARNANSMLYGAIARAAKALGYRHLYTYTLETESGASLRATGWEVDGEVPPGKGWGIGTGGGRPRYERTLLGERRIPKDVPKLRWVRHLRDGCCEKNPAADAA